MVTERLFVVILELLHRNQNFEQNGEIKEGRHLLK